MARTVLLVLAAAAAGFLGGYVARGPGAAPRSARPATPADVSVPERRVADSELARVLEALPVPPRASGDLRIDGTVRFADGRPLAGAAVRAMRRVPLDPSRFLRDDPNAEPDLTRLVVEFVRRHREADANMFRATSDDAGSFALTGLPDGEYWVSVHCDGYELTVDGDEFAQVQPGATVAFAARTVRVVPVRVLRPDGSPPDMATISVLSERGGEERTEWWTSRDASVRLQPGTHALRAHHHRLASDPVRVVVAADGSAPPVTLQLRHRSGLGGRVTFAEGAPLGTVRVHALRLGAAETPDLYRLVEEGETAWVFRGDHTYEFDADEVGPGRYLVGVLLGSTVVASRVVEVGAGSGSRDFVIESLPAGQFVRVEVVGPDGDEVEGVEVRSGAEADGDRLTDKDAALRLHDGGYLVTHHPAAKRDRLFIEVVSKRYGRERVHYERGRTEPLRIALVEPGRLAVTMRGYAGSGHEGFLRAALAPPGLGAKEIEGLGENAPLFDVAGTVALGPTAAGRTHRLIVYAQIGDEFYEAARHDVRLRAGENRLAIPLPPLHRLVVHAPGFEEGAVFVLDPAAAETWKRVKRRVGAGGRVTFERLPPGRFELAPEEALGSVMDVTVPHAGELRFVEPREAEYDAMRVYVSDAGGLVARAGLRDEDLVVGIDGTEFANQRDMQVRMVKAAARPGESVLLVERNGVRIEVRVDLQALLAAGAAAGGGIAPVSR